MKKIKGTNLIILAIILTLLNVAFSQLPHYNFFVGDWRPSNVDWFDVTWGQLSALFIVWVNAEK